MINCSSLLIQTPSQVKHLKKTSLRSQGRSSFNEARDAQAWVFQCRFMLELVVKLLSHPSKPQGKGLSPLWVSLCWVKLVNRGKDFPHSWQICGLEVEATVVRFFGRLDLGCNGWFWWIIASWSDWINCSTGIELGWVMELRLTVS